jgi:hypothetical protein
MNSSCPDDYLEFAHRLALAAGEAILPHFRVALDVEDKGGNQGYDPVTVPIAPRGSHPRRDRPHPSRPRDSGEDA